MTDERKRYWAYFMVKIALEAPRGALITAPLTTKHGVRQTMTSDWKPQAVDGLAWLFSAM